LTWSVLPADGATLMWIDYRERISEGVEALACAERTVRGTAMADRVKLLRLLKAGEQRSLAGAAALLGYSERQAQRWWRCYSESGLAALVQPARRHGGRERVTAAAWQALEAKLRAGEVARLRDARDYLRAQWDIAYTVAGVSKLFQRRRVKRKTGRPQHRRADPAAQAAFKKSAWATRSRAQAAAGVCHGRGPLWSQGHAPAALVPQGQPATLGA
jgi:transposase